MYAKKNPSGIVTDIAHRERQTYQDGSVDIEVSTFPPIALFGKPVTINAQGDWIDTSSVDDELNAIIPSSKVVQALVRCVQALPQGVKSAFPSDAMAILNGYYATIEAKRAGRLMNGKP